MIIFAESQDGCKILNKTKLISVSRRGIAPKWGAIKQPAKNKAINDEQKRFLIK